MRTSYGKLYPANGAGQSWPEPSSRQGRAPLLSAPRSSAIMPSLQADIQRVPAARKPREVSVLRALLPLVTLALTVTWANGNEVRPMQARPDFGELQSQCVDLGGSFTRSPDGNGYACTVADCDGQGGVCTVACDNDRNCVGSTPTRITQPVSLRGILQNGDNIDRKVEPDDGGHSGGSKGTDEPNWLDGLIF
jgi:hypothetical protein